MARMPRTRRTPIVNGTIFLVSMKVTAYKIGDEYALTFVKALDEMSLGLVDKDEPVAEPTDRAFWETKRGTKKTLQITDSLLKIAEQISRLFAIAIDEDIVRRVLARHYHPDTDGCPSWLTFIGDMKDSL